jgi:uncharacterized protein (DUF736 family)
MSDYDDNLRGALFKNDRKEKDTHPDYKGQCEIDGTEYWISAWIKESKAGKKFMSLSFEDKDAPRKSPAQSNGRQNDPADDDIPF